MIKVTRLNDSVMVINVEKIQSLQSTPDTVITFTKYRNELWNTGDQLTAPLGVVWIPRRILTGTPVDWGEGATND